MSDVQAPQAQVSTNDIASGMGLQVMMANKQMELIDSQINKNNVEANKTAGADTDLTIINAKKVELENAYQVIQNDIEKATKDTVIETYSQALQKMEMETDAIILQNDIAEASKESLIKINENNAVNSGIDTAIQNGLPK